MKDKKYPGVALASAYLLSLAIAAFAGPQQEQKDSMADCPMHHKHNAEMNEKGDRAMGFDHMKTAHHFRLLADGGAIEVSANDETDVTSRDQIRQHLSQIAKMFAAGDFEKPLAVHGQVPPGAEAMARFKDSIAYTFEQTDRGGRVRIRTTRPEALAAIHSFLRFQITEHHTGDSLEVVDR